MLREIDVNFGVKIGEPDLSRSCATDVTGESCVTRFAIFGGSHAVRTAKKLSDLGAKIEDCSRGGWVLNKETASDLCDKIRDLDLGGGGVEDVVIIDPLSNSSFFGTDSDGVPVAAKKDGAGKYHLEGDVMVATPAMIRSKLKLLSNRLPSDKNIQYIVIAPTPRYVSDPCCENIEHCTNFAEKTFRPEIRSGIEAIEDTIRVFTKEEGLKATVLNPIKILFPDEDSFSDGTAAAEMWQPADPVHLRLEGYAKVAEAIAGAAVCEEEASETGSLAKRAKLECTVVKTKQENASRVPCIKPGWSSGLLPGPPGPPAAPPGRGSRGGWRGRFQRPYAAPRRGRW